jgi:signal transduction histidine kinase
MSPTQHAKDLIFSAPGEMAERCAAFDWDATPLGPVEGWSGSLRTMAGAVLASRNPMLLFWGPDLIQIYNDAFRPSLGPSTGPASRHPRALGMPAAQFWTDVWDVIGTQIQGVMERGEAVWFEDLHLPIERGDGELDNAWWTYSYSPVRDDDGSIAGTLVVCLETTESVTARAAIEFERKRLADLFRHAPAFLCVLRGPRHVFELTNENYRKLVGFRDVIGKPVREALPELTGQGYFELLDRVLETGEPFIGEGMEVAIQSSANGPLQQRRVNFVFQAITEHDGSRSGVFVHGVDVTEILEARAAAEEANRAKSEFLGVMSHELRTPLNAIDGYAQLLEVGVHGPLNDAQREDVARIRRCEQHLLGLINEVLSYARLEAGALSYDLTDVALHEIMETCEALTEPQASAAGLHLVVNGCPLDLRVRADADRLKQILLNLMTNAIKFTDPGGRVEMTCEVEDQTVRVFVADTGCGIASDQTERIFEPFVQADARYTRSHEGVGLGLAISRELARGMGGDLAVTSTAGEGSTFILTLLPTHHSPTSTPSASGASPA